MFDPLTSLTALHLNSNALAEGGLPDGVFENLTGLATLDLRQNPGSASFVPRADAVAYVVADMGADMGADNVVVRARGVVTLDGSGTHGGPWGTNVEPYAWVEVDAQGNEVAVSAVTEGLSDETEAKARFTAPVLTEERVLHYRLTVTGTGAEMRGAVNRHRASATVRVTVRAGPALIGVEVTSKLQDYEIYGIDKEIEATARFGEAVEVETDGNPVLALDLGGVRRMATFRPDKSGPTKLVFVYTVQEGDPEAGIGFPADPVSLPAGREIRTVVEGMTEDMAVRLRLAATAPVVRMDGVRPELKEMEPPEVLGLTLKLIYHEALDEDSVPAAGAYAVTATNRTGPANPTPLPVSAVGVKGNTVTLTLARAPGVSQMVTMTYEASASNPVRDLAGNEAGRLDESQEVNSVPTVSVGAVHPKAAPGLGDPAFRVTVSQAPASELAVTLSFEQADEYLLETTATITIPAGRTSAARTFVIADDYSLASGALTATIAGVGAGYAPALAPAQRGDGAGVDGEPADRGDVGRERLHGDRGRGGERHGDAAHRRGRAEAAQGLSLRRAHLERFRVGRRRLHACLRHPGGAAGRLDGRWGGIRRVGSGVGDDDGRQHRRGRRAVLPRGYERGRPAPARLRLPRRAPERGRGDALRERGHHRGRRLRGGNGDGGGDGDLDAAQGVGHLRRARAHRVRGRLQPVGHGDRCADLLLRPRRRAEDGDLVCGLGDRHADVLLRGGGRDGRRPGR